MNNIRHEQNQFLAAASVVLSALGVVLTLVPNELVTAAGIPLIAWACISGTRTLFGGFFLQFVSQNGLSTGRISQPEHNDREAGVKMLRKLRVGAVAWSIVFFIFLIVSLSVLLLSIQNGLPVMAAASAASILCTLMFHIHSLYITIKSDMRLKGKQ